MNTRIILAGWRRVISPLRQQNWRVRLRYVLILALLVTLFVPVATIPAQPAMGDYVVLLHGLGRGSWSMKRLEWALKREGYRVVNVSYPSTRAPIDLVATNLLPRIVEDRISDPVARIHFVTHSLGGIIARRYLCEHPEVNAGRLVMLGPPNHGSEIVDRVSSWWLFKRLTGPAGQQLGTGTNSAPNQVGIPKCDIGIIAGDRSFNPLFSAWLAGPDDGKVSVQSARLEGMKDMVVLHRSHTWMTWRKDVVRTVSNFLRDGAF